MLTWVTVNHRAIDHNIKELRKRIGPKVLLMPVIKSNAYGHGLLEIARSCDINPLVNRLCVFSLPKALELRRGGIKKPILILGAYELDLEQIRLAITKKIIFPLYTLKQAYAINRVGESLKKSAIVHLKIDIGTSRIGIRNEELSSFLKKISLLRYVYCEGIFGHLASSEEDEIRTREQEKIFAAAISICTTSGFAVPIRHLACSAATILYRSTHYTAIRMGIMLYGLKPFPKIEKYISLKPALEWFSKILQVKTIPKGSKISYGATFITQRKTTLAIIPVGYWDGYDRGLSNRAFVIINGQRCPVRGRICMNMMMVDVTKLSRVQVGDPVILIGRGGGKTISADELAHLTNTINYEIVTRINPLIPRLVV